MAEIKIGGVTYTAIDDKNASALIENGIGAITIQDKVKIEGNEYIVTRITRAKGQFYPYRISGSRKDYTGYRNFLHIFPYLLLSPAPRHGLRKEILIGQPRSHFRLRNLSGGKTVCHIRPAPASDKSFLGNETKFEPPGITWILFFRRTIHHSSHC